MAGVSAWRFDAVRVSSLYFPIRYPPDDLLKITPLEKDDSPKKGS
jgi:hypothetical protein